MQRSSAVGFLCLEFLLAGCVTPYGPKGAMGGYTDFPVGNGEIAIAVDGNAYTDRSTLLKYFHRRAHEICGPQYTFRSEVDTDTSIESFDGEVSTVNRHAVTGYIKCVQTAPAVVTTRDQAATNAKPVSSRVVMKDGQRCLQGLDADDNVVEEHCQLAAGE